MNSELNFGFLLMKSLEHGTWIEIDIVPRSVPGCWAGCCLVSVRRVTSALVWWWPYSARRTMRREPYTQSITPSATKEKTHSIIIKEREKVWYNKYHCEMLLQGKLLSEKNTLVSHCSTLDRQLNNQNVFLFPHLELFLHFVNNLYMCLSILNKFPVHYKYSKGHTLKYYWSWNPNTISLFQLSFMH